MIVEEQRLRAFQSAQAAYESYLHRRREGEPVRFEEFLSEHEALEPFLRGLHETFSKHAAIVPEESRSDEGSRTDSTPRGSGATTVVDRRRPGGSFERRLGRRAGLHMGRHVGRCVGGSEHSATSASSSTSSTAPSPSVSSSSASPLGSAAGERYVPQGELARGGMGVILKVWDRVLHRTLAMKVLLDESASGSSRSGSEHLARFLQEAQVLTRLDHPGIVPVHDVGFDPEGRPYFTMRYVDGVDLDVAFDHARADRDGWNLSRAVSAMVKVCLTVAYAHARGIIHRDLKPGNVMVGRFGEVYVIDWGLAKVLERRGARGETAIVRRHPESSGGEPRAAAERARPSRRAVRSGHGLVVGTPPFMPPEQARGLGNTLDPRSDIYSLGAILYTLLAGHAPYAPLDDGTPSAAEMTDRVLEGPPTPVRELAGDAPGELIAICEKAMSRDPADRYRSAADMAEEIQSHLDGRMAHPAGLAARLRSWIAGNRAVAGLAGAAIFLVTLFGGLFTDAPESRKSRPVIERATAQEPTPESPAKCSVAKSHAECGDTRSS